MRQVVLIFVLPYILCLPADQDISKLIDEIFLKGEQNETIGKNTTTLNLDPVGDKSTACTTEKGDPGECVSYYLCDPTSLTIIDDGSNLLDLRKTACEHYLDTCCKLTNVVEDASKTTPTPYSDNNINVEHQILEQASHKLPNVEKIKSADVKRTTCGWNNPKIKAFKTVNKEVAENSIYSNYGDFPFMVALIKRSDVSDVWSPQDYLGGGALIHPSYVLTAAHKIAKFEATALKCRAGEYDTQTVKEQFKHQERNVKKVVIHDKYYRTSLYNDVALLTLESPFDSAPHIGVACLGKTLPPEGTSCFAMGWGKDFNKDYEYAVILKKVKLGLVGASNCQNLLQKTRLGPFFRLHDSLTCAGGEEGVDTCRGDGGSPLVCPVDTDGDYTRYAVFGLVAYGINCGSENVPGVYVNVPHLYDWIEQQMDKEHEQKLFIY